MVTGALGRYLEGGEGSSGAVFVRLESTLLVVRKRKLSLLMAVDVKTTNN